jgi:hypothetical protein
MSEETKIEIPQIFSQKDIAPYQGIKVPIFDRSFYKQGSADFEIESIQPNGGRHRYVTYALSQEISGCKAERKVFTFHGVGREPEDDEPFHIGSDLRLLTLPNGLTLQYFARRLMREDAVRINTNVEYIKEYPEYTIKGTADQEILIPELNIKLPVLVSDASSHKQLPSSEDAGIPVATIDREAYYRFAKQGIVNHGDYFYARDMTLRRTTPGETAGFDIVRRESMRGRLLGKFDRTIVTALLEGFVPAKGRL